MKKATITALALVIGAIMSAEAATLFSTNYGDFSAVTVCYNDVIESSGTDATALYYAPTISGNTLNFNPIFTAYSAGGGTDTTDGQLGFDICATSGNFIDKLVFKERGDYSLSSFSPTGNAMADVSASFFVEVLEVDGVQLLEPLNATTTMTFTPDANGTFVLSGFGINDGVWDGAMSIDIEALLADNGIDFIYGATLVHVELDNTLKAISQAGTDAFIAKKDFQGFSVTSIPEPGTATLLGGGSLFLISFRRKLSGLRPRNRTRTCGSYTRMIINHLMGKSVL